MFQAPGDYYNQYGYGYGYGMPGYGAPGQFGAPEGELKKLQIINGNIISAPSPLDAEIQVVIREIQNEIQLFSTAGEYGEQFKNARRLLAAGKLSDVCIENKWSRLVESDKLTNSVDPEWLEVDIPKPIKVTKKILIPNFRHPHV